MLLLCSICCGVCQCVHLCVRPSVRQSPRTRFPRESVIPSVLQSVRQSIPPTDYALPYTTLVYASLPHFFASKQPKHPAPVQETYQKQTNKQRTVKPSANSTKTNYGLIPWRPRSADLVSSRHVPCRAT